MTIQDNFWNFFEVDSNECWNWTRSMTNKGYGHFSLNGKDMTAHRMSWILTNGEIPNGLCVCHKCDNPRCINPNHLFLGTKLDNAKDAIDKGRFRFVSKKDKAFGEKHGLTTLKNRDVKEIVHKYRNGIAKTTKLSKEYGVCVQTICNIVKGKTWSHITGVKNNGN